MTKCKKQTIYFHFSVLLIYIIFLKPKQGLLNPHWAVGNLNFPQLLKPFKNNNICHMLLPSRLTNQRKQFQCFIAFIVHSLTLLPAQTKWQDNRMSTKQVTITVTQSIHQVDKNGKVKKSLTTYEVMKPVETLKQVATQNTWEQEKPGRSQKKKFSF